MEAPRFLPNDIVFGIPDGLPFYDIGMYKISNVKIVPKFVGSNDLRYEFYAIRAAALYYEVRLAHVFKDKGEFLKFIGDYNFEHKSPKE